MDAPLSSTAATGSEASVPPGLVLTDLPTNVWFVGQTSATSQRRDRYTEVSIHGHPGKMLPDLARRLLETYTRPGEKVLDPMSGIGTTGVEAIHLDRFYVGLELEPRYVSWQLENVEHARRQGARGGFAVSRQDARHLDPDFAADTRRDDGALGPFDVVLMSPPFGGRLEPPRNGPPVRFLELVEQRKLSPTALPVSFRLRRDNLGNQNDDNAYFRGMRHVYAGCAHVLKPGGLLLVTLRVGRDRQHLRPLHHETARLCQALGFDLLDEIIAVLGRVETQPEGTAEIVGHASWIRRSIIARLRRRGYPATLNQVEYILVFQKPQIESSPMKTTKAASRPPLSAQRLA